MTLEKWLEQPGADKYRPITVHQPAIGIHDVMAITDVRPMLWALDDYYVSSVQGGVIWLQPKETVCK